MFLDAGSVQSWGRFLEVAPQRWNGTLVKCPGLGGSSCGTADEDTIPRSTSDAGTDLEGYTVCISPASVLPGEAGATGTAIGDGRRNTEVFSQTPECTDGSTTAVTLSVGYRGGGLTDWYVPSADELVALCTYEGRNAIGGFVAGYYASSTALFERVDASDLTNFIIVDFSRSTCLQNRNVRNLAGSRRAGDPYFYEDSFVRPIRAFG